MSESAGHRRSDGYRTTLEIDNLFDARPEAALGDGRAAHGRLRRSVRLSVSRRSRNPVSRFREGRRIR